ncbi:uncharacterized protein LOC105193374 [Solenopsis invicta]|uniref:uncharacterized protein LOC105193374 n=1 Tax=Solenopsis invicta TaxID=13686 RepID=UPI000595C334|nr:uncharacterized protein LOC105193374 [Solenopsis invicta]
MLKITIIAILALASAATDEDSKDRLLLIILEAKNRAFDQVQTIKMLAATNVDKFTVRVTEMVEKSRSDMEILQKELINTNDVCDKAKNNIDDAALKTIAHFQFCVEKITDAVDSDMNSLAFEGSLLTKEIQNTKTINDDVLQHKVTDFDTKSFQFANYVQKLEKCETQSNLLRLKRQISETLTSYKQCLQDK